MSDAPLTGLSITSAELFAALRDYYDASGIMLHAWHSSDRAALAAAVDRFNAAVARVQRAAADTTWGPAALACRDAYAAASAPPTTVERMVTEKLVFRGKQDKQIRKVVERQIPESECRELCSTEAGE